MPRTTIDVGLAMIYQEEVNRRTLEDEARLSQAVETAYQDIETRGFVDADFDA